ncbi:MAG: hypothetical protein NVS4B12_13790 [Ktedonobacteraceae bacterium]
MRHIRLFLYSLIMLVALLTTLVSLGVQGSVYAHSSQQAKVHITCSGNGCDNVDPQQSGCSVGAYTVQSLAYPTVYIQLRYSPRCGTNWGRVITRGKHGGIYLVLVDRIDGVSYGTKGLTGPVAWSRMVYAPKAKARGCVSINGANPVCTAYI